MELEGIRLKRILNQNLHYSNKNPNKRVLITKFGKRGFINIYLKALTGGGVGNLEV